MLGIHHMPFRNDDALDAIGTALAQSDGQCGIARDGDVIELNGASYMDDIGIRKVSAR